MEVDQNLKPVLAETMAPHDNLEIIFGDVLKQDIELEEYMSLISFSHLWIHRQLLKGIPFYIFCHSLEIRHTESHYCQFVYQR